MVIIATVLRLILILNNWPTTNSDEGNMGILGLHVAYNGEWPIFFYGLPYLGPVEGYIAAPLFHLFGSSLFSLRLGLIPFYVLFLVSMYFLTKQLFTRNFAVFIVFLLCLGNAETVQRQLKAVGEYPEILAFSALISLLVVWFAQTQSRLAGRRTTWGRCLLYALLGAVIGQAIWVDMLILPLVGTALLLLVLFCRREVLSWAGLSLLVGLIIGSLPLIIYNATAPASENSINTLLWILRAHTNAGYTFLDQLVGTFGISVPDVMNFRPTCVDSPTALINGHHTLCAVAQLTWGAGSVLMLFVALIFAVIALWRVWLAARTPDRSFLQALLRPIWTEEQRQLAIRYCASLMLLISSVVTFISFLKSANPALAPGPTARYLIIFLVALPTMAWPLWLCVSRRVSFAAPGQILRGVSALLLALFLGASVLGIVNTFQTIPQAQAMYNTDADLVQHLEQIGATRIYSEYWTCNNLTFQSRERVICAALYPNLEHGFDRYMPFRAVVEAKPYPGYIFPQGMPQIAALDRQLKAHKLSPKYHREVYGNYVLYYVP